MTSANVSNMSMQVATSNVSTNKVEQTSVKNDFLQVMSSNMKGNRTEFDVLTPDKTAAVENTADTAAKMNAKPNEIKSVEEKPISEEVAEKTKEEVENFAEEVKDVISEELDVTEDEIVQAMEELGLTFLDLTNTTNLAELVAKLTECENNVVLLVDESFTNILSQVNDLTDAIMKQTGCKPEELQEITNQLDEISSMGEQTVAGMGNPDANISDEAALPETQTLDNPEIHDKEISATVTEVSEEAMTVETETEDVVGVTQQTEEIEDADTTAEEVPEEGMKEQDAVVTKDGKEQSTSEDDGQFFEQNQSRRDVAPETMIRTDHLQANGHQTISQYEPVTGDISLQTGEVVNARELVEQIVESARTTITSENTTIEMLLKPEGLGKILMEVTESDGKVTAKIFTQDENVKQALENQMVQLKDQMNQSGTKVNSIEVSVGTHEFEKDLEEGQQDRQQEEAARQQESRKSRNINLNSLDELSGLMTEEEELVAKIMRDNGNSVNFTA